MDESCPDEYTIHKLPQIDSSVEFGVNGNIHEQHDERPSDREARKRFSMDELSAYDLRPPPPTVSDANAELIAERLFSAEHLNIILKDPAHFQHFRAFLNRYRPQSVPTLVRYLESQKALTAIRYANALADQIATHSRQSSRSSTKSDAAIVDLKFENFSIRAVDELVTDALPAYITYRMVSVVTECLVKEITGNSTPIMRGLVQGLAEVYCMTDPQQPDNPIVFASEEFYNTTQYGREYVIGKNCRFLQGPKTQKPAVKRITNALRNGQEICETLLNYRRDGSPFLNLVMMAPLMDSHGQVRYFIGAQIDISYLLEGGKGLDSFKQLLDQEQEAMERAENPDPIDHKPSLKLLRELGDLLNDEEVEIVRHRTRSNSIESTVSTPTRATLPNRRLLGMDEPEPHIWPPSVFGSSGRLPGVYQNYLLVRPYPSLRIIFTSAALRIPGLSQSKLMDRIGGPQHVRDGLLDALSHGIGVTAKISWLTRTSRSKAHHLPSDDASISTDEVGNLYEGHPRWIHCTPLLGSDHKPGVIMVVMVDREEITGALHSHNSSPRHIVSRQTLRHRDHTKDGWPLQGSQNGVNAGKYTGSKLYADYLRREGRNGNGEERGLPATPLEEGARMGAVISGMASLHSPSVGGSGRSTPANSSAQAHFGSRRRSVSMRRKNGRETA